VAKRGKRPEDVKKMSKIEIEVNAKLAAELYDTFTADTRKNIDTKAAFILGFIHGIEKAYEEIGMYDDPDDIDKIYDFLDKNVDRFQK
jgi:hypothetical protein